MPYDATLKSLFENLGFSLATLLLGIEVTPGSLILLGTENPRVETRRADLVFRVETANEGPLLVHIELQNQNDRDMPVRMMRYASDILSAYPGENLQQYMIYTGTDALKMPDFLALNRGIFRYTQIDMRAIDCRRFLEADSPEALVLAILCDFKGLPADTVVEEILRRLQKKLASDDFRLKNYVFMLEILSKNRKLESLVKEKEKMLTDVRLEELPSFELGFEKGIENGLEKGLERGIAQGLEKGIAQGLEKGIAQGLERGIAQGLEKGIVQGIGRGEEKKQRDIARKMLEDGLPIAFISKYTGMAPDELTDDQIV
jgi:predicted transposase YdaD